MADRLTPDVAGAILTDILDGKIIQSHLTFPMAMYVAEKLDLGKRLKMEDTYESAGIYRLKLSTGPLGGQSSEGASEKHKPGRRIEAPGGDLTEVLKKIAKLPEVNREDFDRDNYADRINRRGFLRDVGFVEPTQYDTNSFVAVIWHPGFKEHATNYFIQTKLAKNVDGSAGAAIAATKITPDRYGLHLYHDKIASMYVNGKALQNVNPADVLNVEGILRTLHQNTVPNSIRSYLSKPYVGKSIGSITPEDFAKLMIG